VVARLFCDRRKFDLTLVRIEVCAADISVPATFLLSKMGNAADKFVFIKGNVCFLVD
jgi:hypothetical protein